MATRSVAGRDSDGVPELTASAPGDERARALLWLVRDSTEPVRLRVRGDCMTPHLRDGDDILVVRRALYLPGDMLAFYAGDGRFLVHRLLGYRPRWGRLELVTGADNAPGWDDPVPLCRVIGRVVEHRVQEQPRAAQQAGLPLPVTMVTRVGASERLRALGRFFVVAVSRLVRRGLSRPRERA